MLFAIQSVCSSIQSQENSNVVWNILLMQEDSQGIFGVLAIEKGIEKSKVSCHWSIIQIDTTVRQGEMYLQ